MEGDPAQEGAADTWEEQGRWLGQESLLQGQDHHQLLAGPHSMSAPLGDPWPVLPVLQWFDPLASEFQAKETGGL